MKEPNRETCMKKRFAPFVMFCGLLVGCSSVHNIASEEPVPERACNVTVYQTKGQALKHGDLEELCVITGTSSGSFTHTVATAIEKHKDKACSCGATDVYIESREETWWEIAKVSMVAFKFAVKKTPSGLK